MISFRRFLEESKNPNYTKFRIYGELVSDNIRTRPILTELKLKNAMKKLGGSDRGSLDNSIILNEKPVKDVDNYLIKEGFRRENANMAKETIFVKPEEKIYGFFVKDQKHTVDIKGTMKNGKFHSEFPYNPIRGEDDEVRRLMLTVETRVVIMGRNTMFDEEQVWFAHIFAPKSSNLDKDMKSGAYRFSFKRDVTT